VTRLTNTAKVMIVAGIITIVTAGLFSLPSTTGADPEDLGIFTDQYSIEESFVPFRTVGEPRTTITQTGDVVEVSADFTNAIESLTAQQVSDLILKLPDDCRVKLLTTIVFEDGTKRDLSSGATTFAPIQTLSLIDIQGSPIKEFQTVPLLTCDVIVLKDGVSRLGYVHQWLQGVNINWEFVKEDGTKDSVNTQSSATSTAPRCTPVLFDDTGDLATAGYTTSQIKQYSDTFGDNKDAIFIGSERALCAKDANGVIADPFIITADEVESRLGDIAGKEFETTLTIRMTAGTIILEVPELSFLLGEPFIARTALDQFLSRQILSFTVDNLADIPPEDVTPPPTGVTRTIVLDSFSPTKIDVAKLSASDRTVTMRIKLNSYDVSEGIPQIVVKKLFCINFAILDCTNFGSATTATISMGDAGVSGLSRIFEGKWVVSTGQSLGTYELKVSMQSRTNDLVKHVEIVQNAKDAPSDTPVNGQCTTDQQLVQDLSGMDICVAKCADNLIWDVAQNACAEEAFCTAGLNKVVDDSGKVTCVEDPIMEGICSQGLTFNQNTMKCEGETKTQIPVCKDDEQLNNIGGGNYECVPKLDVIKLLTPIACADKIGFTDEGLCLPPIIAGLFQEPIQLIYLGVAFIIFLVVVKILFNAVNRQRGGIVLQQ